jgi:NADPH:quinone reductase-like Zn-dependent oxidoreductase
MMRALIHDPSVPSGLRLASVAEPQPRPGHVLVDIQAISLNFGEVAFRHGQEPGSIVGWDAAGTVRTGELAGCRVVTFGWGGGWAERRAVDVADLAVVPEPVDLGAASTLPVAGVTALRALRRLGSVVGRRILVTGASGGVGRFAVQLAAHAGAHVIAAVGSAARGAGLTDLGAAEVVVGLHSLTQPVFGVLENVGGDHLAKAFDLVVDGGTVQSIGMASRQPTTIDFEQARLTGGRKRVESFTVGTERFGADLTYLVGLLADGKLDPQIGWRGSWERAPDAVEALLARRVPGKAVLDLRPPGQS